MTPLNSSALPASSISPLYITKCPAGKANAFTSEFSRTCTFILLRSIELALHTLLTMLSIGSTTSREYISGDSLIKTSFSNSPSFSSVCSVSRFTLSSPSQSIRSRANHSPKNARTITIPCKIIFLITGLFFYYHRSQITKKPPLYVYPFAYPYRSINSSDKFDYIG